MKGIMVLILLALVVPVVAADSHLPVVTGVTVEAGNQILRIRWDPVPGDLGYAVLVYSETGLVQQINTTETTANFRGAVNERSYAVEVAARDPAGGLGPRSDPVGATPALRHDQTYLALGLIIVWLGIWAYAALLTRIERDLHVRLEKIQSARSKTRGRT